jgi:hypothetical protein
MFNGTVFYATGLTKLLTNFLRSLHEVGVHYRKSDMEVLRCYLVAKATLIFND